MQADVWEIMISIAATQRSAGEMLGNREYREAEAISTWWLIGGIVRVYALTNCTSPAPWPPPRFHALHPSLHRSPVATPPPTGPASAAHGASDAGSALRRGIGRNPAAFLKNHHNNFLTHCNNILILCRRKYLVTM